MNSPLTLPPALRARLAACLFTFLGALPFARADQPIVGLSATAAQPVHPLLTRVEHGPLLRLTLEVGKGDGWNRPRNDLSITSVSFSLAGTDDLADLQSLSLVSTETDENFVMTHWPRTIKTTELTPLGEPVAPSANIVFRLNQPLVPGKNVFWLTTRLRDNADLRHRVAATCTGIETSAGRIVPASPSSARGQRIGRTVRKGGDDGVFGYAIPSLATTAAGTLLSAYDMRWNYPADDLQDHITTGLSRSTDGGKTWEPNRIIFNMENYGGLPPDQNGCSDAGLVVDRQTGEIFAFVIWMHGNAHHHQWRGTGSAQGFEIGKTAQLLMTRSRDDGKTWSPPENLTRKLKPESWWLLAPAPTQGIQLADGTLVMPMQGRDEFDRYYDTIMTSRDHGATWKVGKPAWVQSSEGSIAQLGDGSIMLNMRNENEDDTYGMRGVYVTRDLGQTWEPHVTHLNTLIEPNCNASLLRVDYEEGGTKKHVLLFMNPHRQTRDRTHHMLQVSFDDGVTWPRTHYLMLDEGFGWGYPCLSRIDADHVGVVYAGSQADVQFQVLSLKEILHR